MTARYATVLSLCPPGRFFTIGLGLIALLFLTISPLALVEFGFNYEDTGGGPLEKIHPATLIAFTLFFLALAARRNALSALGSLLERHPATAAYLLVLALLTLFSMRIVKLPFTPIIDTFFAPALMFLLYQGLPEGRARWLALLLHFLLVANAIVGLGEFATGERLTPLVASGVVIDDDWRSSALLGHPLANASLTGAYLLILALGGGKDLPFALRVLAFLIAATGMVVFGGRASTALVIVMLILLAMTGSVRIARGASFRKSTVLGALILLPLIGVLVTVLAESGFFDQFISRLTDDKGSAETRIEMFELFHHIPLWDLIFAPDARQIETLRFMHGLDFGIESFFVAFILSYGVIMGLVFFAVLFAFCRELLRAVAPGAIWVLVFFFLVAATSVSLSAKTPLFAELVLLVMVLLRLRLPAPPRAPRMEFEPSSQLQPTRPRLPQPRAA